MWPFKRCKHDWYVYETTLDSVIYSGVVEEFGLNNIKCTYYNSYNFISNKICLKCEKIVNGIDDKYAYYRRKAIDTIADLEFKDKLLKKHKLGKYKEENSGQTN